MEPVVLEGFSIALDPCEVLRFLGTKARGKPAPGERYDELVSDLLSAAERLIAPRGMYVYAAGSELPGSKTFEHFERMAFCVCTIGPGLEDEVTRLTKSGDILRGVVLDAVGSVAAEAVAEYIARKIAAEAAREGLKTSCRSSPGYGDWDVREQGAIFELLPAQRIGVRLSQSFMMIPRKSISFALHVAKEPVKLRSESSCDNCSKKDCPLRLVD